MQLMSVTDALIKHCSDAPLKSITKYNHASIAKSKRTKLKCKQPSTKDKRDLTVQMYPQWLPPKTKPFTFPRGL